MSYRLTGEAQRDLISIRDYTLRNWGTKQSRDYLTRLRTVLIRLAEMPTMGQNRTEELGEEIYSFPHISHMIYYIAEGADILILAILHQSQVPARHLSQRL